ncbi:hypothetical protein C8R43DRAFT_959488 [Mycena crocata]|nr:hypothetical protein C8R43DRAFT_959488 [Mycena crocata]
MREKIGEQVEMSASAATMKREESIKATDTAKYLGSSSPGSGVGIRLGVAEGWQEEKWFEWNWDCGGKRQVAKLDAAWLAHLIIMIDLWVFSLLEPDWNRTLKSMRGFYLRIRREMVFSHLQNTYGYIFGTFWSLDTRSLLQLWQVKFQFATWLCAFATCSLSVSSCSKPETRVRVEIKTPASRGLGGPANFRIHSGRHGGLPDIKFQRLWKKTGTQIVDPNENGKPGPHGCTHRSHDVMTPTKYGEEIVNSLSTLIDSNTFTCQVLPAAFGRGRTPAAVL